MCSSNALVVLRDLSVEFGNYDGKLPLIIRGHIKFLVGSPDVQFSNNHNYLFSGVDYNYVKGYVCQCGEAFFGLGSALMHYTERFEQSTVSACANYANESYFQSSVRRDGFLLRCNVKNNHEMNTVRVDEDLTLKSVSMENDGSENQGSTGSKERLEIPLICECIFRSFGYEFNFHYHKELGKQLGVASSEICNLMKEFASYKGESPNEAYITPELRSKAVKIHTEILEKLKTLSHETGYVEKNLALLYAIRKTKGVKLDMNFRKACEKIFSWSVRQANERCCEAGKDCEKLDALIVKPSIQKEADILYASICREQGLMLEDTQLQVEKENRESEARLIVEGIFLRGGAVLSNPYIHECAKRLGRSFAVVKSWYTNYLNCSELKRRMVLTEDILQKSKDLDKKIKESIGETNLVPHSQRFTKIHLIIEGIYQIYEDVNMDVVYRKILSEKLKVQRQTILGYLNKRKKIRKMHLEKPSAHLITKTNLNRSKECHEYVMQKIEDITSKDGKYIFFGKMKISKTRLIFEYLSKVHCHSQSLELRKAYAEELGMDMFVARQCWDKISLRRRNKTPFISDSLFTSSIRVMAEGVHKAAVERMKKTSKCVT